MDFCRFQTFADGLRALKRRGTKSSTKAAPTLTERAKFSAKPLLLGKCDRSQSAQKCTNELVEPRWVFNAHEVRPAIAFLEYRQLTSRNLSCNPLLGLDREDTLARADDERRHLDPGQDIAPITLR
jgi:hypothetical protein